MLQHTAAHCNKSVKALSTCVSVVVCVALIHFAQFIDSSKSRLPHWGAISCVFVCEWVCAHIRPSSLYCFWCSWCSIQAAFGVEEQNASFRYPPPGFKTNRSCDSTLMLTPGDILTVCVCVRVCVFLCLYVLMCVCMCVDIFWRWLLYFGSLYFLFRGEKLSADNCVCVLMCSICGRETMYIYIYISICMYIYTFMHLYLYINVSMSIFSPSLSLSIFISISISILNICICICIYIYIYIYVYVCICMCVYI